MRCEIGCSKGMRCAEWETERKIHHSPQQNEHNDTPPRFCEISHFVSFITLFRITTPLSIWIICCYSKTGTGTSRHPGIYAFEWIVFVVVCFFFSVSTCFVLSELLFFPHFYSFRRTNGKRQLATSTKKPNKRLAQNGKTQRKNYETMEYGLEWNDME